MNLLAKAAGLNWYKYGAILLVIVAWTGLVYGTAAYRCNLKHEQAKTEEVAKKHEAVVEDVKARIPVVQDKEAKAAEERQEIKRLKEALDAAIKNRSENPSCDLSDDEFNSVRDLAAKTHTR